MLPHFHQRGLRATDWVQQQMKFGLAVTVALVLVGVTACSGTGPSSTPTPTGTPIEIYTTKPQSVPSVKKPKPTYSSDPDLLFTITGTATNALGAEVELRQEVFAPVELDELPVELQQAFTTECEWFNPKIDDYKFVRTAVTVTDVSTFGRSWPTAIAPGNRDSYLFAAAGEWPAFSGAFAGFSARCASVVVFPGTTTGAAAVLRAAGADDEGGWAQTTYGFGAAYDGNPQEQGDTLPRFDDCIFAFGPAGAESDAAQQWAWIPTTDAFDYCMVG